MAPSESTRYTPPTNDAELVLAWLRRARESQFFHYDAAKRLGRYGRVFGVPVIVITAIVGASAFASILSQTVPLYAKLIVGLCSLVDANWKHFISRLRSSPRSWPRFVRSSTSWRRRHLTFTPLFSRARRRSRATNFPSGRLGSLLLCSTFQ